MITSLISSYSAAARRSSVVRVLSALAVVALTYLILTAILSSIFGAGVWAGAVAPALVALGATLLFMGAMEFVGWRGAVSKAKIHANGGHKSPF